MKKMILIMTIVMFAVACNNSAETSTTTDSTNQVESTVVTTDSTATVDSTAAVE